MISKKTLITLSLSMLVAIGLIPQMATAQMPRTPSPEGAKVYVISPHDIASIM